jgi:chorismate mutase
MTYEEEIAPLRDEINRLNGEIVEKLAERVSVATEIGDVKHRYGKPIVDLGREEKVLNQARALAEDARIDPVGVERVFREIIALCTQAELEDEA